MQSSVPVVVMHAVSLRYFAERHSLLCLVKFHLQIPSHCVRVCVQPQRLMKQKKTEAK